MPQGKRTIQSYLIDEPMSYQRHTPNSPTAGSVGTLPPRLPVGRFFGEWEFRTDESVIGECVMECARGRV